MGLRARVGAGGGDGLGGLRDWGAGGWGLGRALQTAGRAVRALLTEVGSLGSELLPMFSVVRCCCREGGPEGPERATRSLEEAPGPLMGTFESLPEASGPVSAGTGVQMQAPGVLSSRSCGSVSRGRSGVVQAGSGWPGLSAPLSLRTGHPLKSIFPGVVLLSLRHSFSEAPGSLCLRPGGLGWGTGSRPAVL